MPSSRGPQTVAMWGVLILLVGYLLLAVFGVVPRGQGAAAEVPAAERAAPGRFPPPPSQPTVLRADGSAPDLLPARPEDSTLRRPRPEPGREEGANSELSLDEVAL